jgi:MtfA peptidase
MPDALLFKKLFSTAESASVIFLQQPQMDAESAFLWLLLLGLVMAVVVLPQQLQRWIWLRFLFVKKTGSPEEVAEVLEKKFLYYRQLPTPLHKERFANRVWRFRCTKKFSFVGFIPENKWEASVLVSAAAVQLTFGLEDYYLWSFRDIRVMPKDYTTGFYSQPFQGHVLEDAIHFSWKHFKEGYAIPDNMHNVGLHEMAHALTVECFNRGELGDRWFKENFHRYSAVARPIFEMMRKGTDTMLGQYAATNYHEFWAVSVEAFFEQPGRLRADLPALYEVMCHLMRQDPLATISGDRHDVAA